MELQNMFLLLVATFTLARGRLRWWSGEKHRKREEMGEGKEGGQERRCFHGAVPQ
jgi:hypothetical protein